MNLKSLSDQSLLNQTKGLFEDERKITLDRIDPVRKMVRAKKRAERSARSENEQVPVENTLVIE